MRRFFAGLLLAGAGFFCLAFPTTTMCAEGDSGIESHPWIGKAAPGFDLETVAGERLSLEGLEGKYAVIHFGASW